MLLYSKKNSPDIECRDLSQMEAAKAKGYEYNPKRTVEPVKVEEVDTPEDAYERKFGKPPHHKMKLQTIIDALED